jgi:hypothetical protein
MANRIVRRAYERPEFLSSAEGRSIRILSEYLEPEQRLNALRIWHTVVFFGSARIRPEKETADDLARLEKAGDDESGIRSARVQHAMSRYYEDARALARMLTEWAQEQPEEERLYVCSGGGGGIMEAANRGASEAGGKTVSLNIQLPFEQKANSWAQDDLTFDFHYFFMRKFWFVYRAKAILVFPGGFGTLDELMESLTLTQTRRVDKLMPIIIYGREFWDGVINLQKLVERGMISPGDLDLFHFANTPEEAMAYLQQRLSFEIPDVR